MPEMFPLIGHPRCFIPTRSASFIESIIDDILEDIFYPHQRESDPSQCFPTILTTNSFVQQMKADEAMELVDDFCSRRFKKLTMGYFEETYNINKIYDDYMTLKPTCFLVLGTPSKEHCVAAKIFADRTNRVHLDVVELVNLEMSKDSQCGKWIYSNLCAGRCIPISIVLELVEAAIRSNKVQQRGYVLSGFPIVPEQIFSMNKLPIPLSEMPELKTPPADSVAEWLMRKNGIDLNENPMDTSSHNFIDEHKVVTSSSNTGILQLPEISNGTCSSEVNIESEDISFTSFVSEIMNSPHLKNKLCEDDIKRSVRHQLNVLLHLNLVPDIVFYIRRETDGEWHPKTAEGSVLLEEADGRHADTQRQRDRYQNCLHEVGKFVLHYHKDNVIKIDSRLSPEAIANQLQTGVAFINYKMVHIPEWIMLDTDLKKSLSKLSSEQLLDFLCEYQCIQANLPWKKSETGVMCPVKLHSGKIQQGLIDHVVRYLGHVFLLSSLSALSQFMADPNKYFFVKPNCRVAIISPEMKQSNSITSVLQRIFQAESFNWKDKVSKSPEVHLMDIHDEARRWAEENFEESKDAFYGDPSTPFQYKPGEVTTMTDLLDYKFYELYKQKHATEIAKLVIDWLVNHDSSNATQDKPQLYAQWIIQDAPTTFAFWEELEAKECLPDVVICLLESWNVEGSAEDMYLQHEDRRDIEIFFTNIKSNFPKLLSEDENINIEELIGNDVSELDPPLNINKGSNVASGRSSVRDSKTETTDNNLLEFLTKRCIPVVVTAKQGREGLLDILEKYMSVFKYPGKILDEQKVDELCKISCATSIEQPNIIRKLFLDYNFIYKLDMQYLQNDAEFQYNEQLRNFGGLSMAAENDSKVQIFDELDRLYDIDVLSEDNIQNMKEKDNLRQVTMGSTGRYCPVALSNQKLLRLGNMRFTVEYGDRLYRMSSDQALQEFMKCPFRYTFEGRKPPIPPYRVCVIGPASPNRNSFVKLLSRRLNMEAQSFTKLFTEFLQAEYSEKNAISNTEDEMYEQYGIEFLKSMVKPLFNLGIILEGFPNNESQLQDMLDHSLYPEVVYVVDETPNEALHFTFVQHHLRWEKQLQFKYRTYLQKLARLTRLSAKKNDGGDAVNRLRLQSADIKLALNNIKRRIKSTQEAMLGEDVPSQPQLLSIRFTENSSSILLPMADSVSQKSEGDLNKIEKQAKKSTLTESAFDNASELLSPEVDIEDTEEEVELHPESPVPSPLEEITIKKNLMGEAKVSLKRYLIELRKIIRLCISSNLPVIKMPNNCAQKKLESKLEICSLKLRKFIYDQIIIVSPEIARQCQQQGYALYSHFKNFCPVDAFNLIPANLHFTMKNRGTLNGVIYRNLLYYINGSENLVRFSRSPQKFTSKESLFYLVLPMRILVIGPVSSGVTTLCERISLEFNMKLLSGNNFGRQRKTSPSRDQIIENQAEDKTVPRPNLPSEVDFEFLVDELHMHRNDSPNGIVLDNYPIVPKDLVTAAEANIAVHIVMIIKTEFWAVWRNWKTTYLLEDRPRCASIHTQLAKLYDSFRKYNTILKKYQTYPNKLELFNLIYLKSIGSRWSLWEEAKSEILLCLREVGNYNKNVGNQQIVSISRMNVFRSEFEKRMSPVKLFCPICLKLEGRLVKYRHDFQTVGEEFYSHACQQQFTQPFGYNFESLYPKYKFPKPEAISEQIAPIFSKNMFKANLVQYLGNFYWTCDKHHIDILLNGRALLPPERLIFPPYIPFLVTNFFRKDVANDGYCIVTYTESAHKGVMVVGNPNYAVYYRGKIFLCASADCALQLLENPRHYYRMEIEYNVSATEDPDAKNMEIDYGNLTPEIIVEALTALGEARPKHFALDTANSAAIYVGLYLKTINPKSTPEVTQFNESVFSKFVDECSYLQWLIKKYHETKNPFIMS